MTFVKSVFAVSTLALAPFAFAQKSSTPIDLGTLGGSASIANGVSSFDVVVGGANVWTDAFQHTVYTTSLGYLQDLESLIGPFGNSVANGISKGNAITGTSDQIIDSDGDIGSHAFYFTGSRTGLQDLGTNGGTLSFGQATQNGMVVGYSTIIDDVAYCAFLWTKVGGMVNLDTLAADACNDGYNSYAYGIDNKNKAVGSSDALDGTTHAVSWLIKSDSASASGALTATIVDLGTLGGSLAQLNSVNNTGVAAGLATSPDDSQTFAVVTSGRHLVSIGSLGGSYASAQGINDSGTVVGFSNITGDTDVHAFVWSQSTGMVDLNSMLPAGSVFTELTSANAIGVDGTIVGVGITADGEAHAFVW